MKERKEDYGMTWRNTAKLEEDLQLGSSRSATSVVIIKCCKQKPKQDHVTAQFSF